MLPLNYDGKVLVVDLETTGLHPESDRVLELSIVEFPHGFGGGEKGTFCRPWGWSFSVDRESTPEAYAVHGIASSDQADCESFKDAAHEIAAVLGVGEEYPHYIFGHGVGFDMAFLREEFMRAGAFTEGVAKAMGRPLCTKQAAWQWLPDLEDASLDRCCEFFNIQGRRLDHHDAAEDAEITSKLAWKLCVAPKNGLKEAQAISDEAFPPAFLGFDFNNKIDPALKAPAFSPRPVERNPAPVDAIIAKARYLQGPSFFGFPGDGDIKESYLHEAARLIKREMEASQATKSRVARIWEGLE